MIHTHTHTHPTFVLPTMDIKKHTQINKRTTDCGKTNMIDTFLTGHFLSVCMMVKYSEAVCGVQLKNSSREPLQHVPDPDSHNTPTVSISVG